MACCPVGIGTGLSTASGAPYILSRSGWPAECSRSPLQMKLQRPTCSMSACLFSPWLVSSFFCAAPQAEIRVLEKTSAKPGVLVLAPQWVYLSVAYSLFLWASISQISLRSLRPDMLMSGFLYVAGGMLLRMQGSAARWNRYLALGVVLGIGFLAKAPCSRSGP